MGGRYLVTGVQLGMLSAMHDISERKKMIDAIVESQFIWDSDKSIDEDVASIMRPFTETKGE